jgi:hypothetical protein
MTGEIYFSESAALALFLRWKAAEDLAALNELLKLCIPIVERLISRRGTTRFETAEELRGFVLLRLSRSLQRLYDPAKGRLFTFVSKSTESALIDAVRRKRRETRFLRPLDDILFNAVNDNGKHHLEAVDEIRHREALDDIRYRILRIKTLSTCPFERDAQRWLVKNLLESNFVFRRHQAADAMTIVYGLTPERSRKLYDITLLSVRRELIGERKLKPVRTEELLGTRSKVLLRYRPRVSELEFARLVYLMQNLAVSLIEGGEFTLQEILYGSGAETPLFAVNGHSSG